MTEAASQGTPAVVYTADGLRDSVQDEDTGIVVKTNTPVALAAGLEELLMEKDTYELYRKRAWEESKKITFDQSYKDFIEVLKHG